MAHHVSELIHRAKRASNPTERAKARKLAAETILKIWEHRKALPGNADPLKSYDSVIKVLVLLSPDANPFKHFGDAENAKRNELAALLFDRLSRLVIAVLLMNRAPAKRAAKADSSIMKALYEKEQYILIALQMWSDILTGPKKHRKASKGKTKNPKANLNLNEAALDLIDSAAKILGGLQSELQNAPAQTKV